MYPVLRPLLFAFEPESSHGLALRGLDLFGALPGPVRPLAGRRRRAMGIEFANPVGLAAGLDKDALAVRGLAKLGFGHLELGTVTPRPQAGNRPPRLFRLPRAQALINRMGLNNAGAAALAARLRRAREQGWLAHTPVGVSIGKNRDTPLEDAHKDYLACMDALHGVADYFALNLSSPSAPGLRSLQQADPLRRLLGALKERQAQLAAGGGRQVPFAVKLAPDLDEASVAAIAEQLLAFEVDGVIAGNSTLSRPGLTGMRHASQAGGLSGAPLAPLARRLASRLHALLGERLPIIGCGGLLSAADAQALLDAGASLVQIYTGLVYRGPSLIKSIAAL